MLTELIFSDDWLFEDVSAGARQAKSMGLEKKPGIGLYGPPSSTVATHRIRNGVLIPIVGKIAKEKTSRGIAAAAGKSEGESTLPKTQLGAMQKAQDELVARLATPSPKELLQAEEERKWKNEAYAVEMPKRAEVVLDRLRTYGSNLYNVKKFTDQHFGMNIEYIIADYAEVFGGLDDVDIGARALMADDTGGSLSFTMHQKSTGIKMSRYFSVETIGSRKKISMENAVFYAPVKSQKKDNAKKMLGAMLRVADKLGITEVTVMAAMETGGYVWLRAGAQPSKDDFNNIAKIIHKRLATPESFTEFKKKKLVEKEDNVKLAEFNLSRFDSTVQGDPTEEQLKERETLVGNLTIATNILNYYRDVLSNVSPEVRNDISEMFYRLWMYRQTDYDMLYDFIKTDLGKVMMLGLSWSGAFDLSRGSKGRQRVEDYAGSYRERQILMTPPLKKNDNIPNSVMDSLKDVQTQIIGMLSTPAPGDLGNLNR